MPWIGIIKRYDVRKGDLPKYSNLFQVEYYLIF